MEDLFCAGGLPAVMHRVADLLHKECLTANGKSLGENFSPPGNDNVIRPLDQPVYAEGGIAVLYGNLAPDGAVIKQSAASADLLQHRGRALVFDTRDEIMLDVRARKLNLVVEQAEIERRLSCFIPSPRHYTRGYGRLFLDHVTQAHLGCDFDFLMPDYK